MGAKCKFCAGHLKIRQPPQSVERVGPTCTKPPGNKQHDHQPWKPASPGTMISIGPTAGVFLPHITVNSLPRKPWNNAFYRAQSQGTITVITINFLPRKPWNNCFCRVHSPGTITVITVNFLTRKPWNNGFYRAHSRGTITIITVNFLPLTTSPSNLHFCCSNHGFCGAWRRLVAEAAAYKCISMIAQLVQTIIPDQTCLAR